MPRVRKAPAARPRPDYCTGKQPCRLNGECLCWVEKNRPERLKERKS